MSLLYLLAVSDPTTGAGAVGVSIPAVAAAVAPDLPPSPPSPVSWPDVSGKPAFGTASLAASGDFATASQGTKADTALQDAAAFATAAQGTRADSAVQPAGLTKAAVGLGNADNTSDANKPISSATQTALDAKLASNAAAVTNGRKPEFVAGDGGTVTQATNKSTGVTLNKRCGQITMNGAALAAAAEVAFVVTNNTVAATDVPLVCLASVGTAAAYHVGVGAVANGSFTIVVGNMSAGSLSQALVLNFVIVKSVVA